MLNFRLFLLIIFIFIYEISLGQAGMWTCLSPGGPAFFGIQGVADSANNPPPVYEPAEWTDTSGNFWFYGGSYNWSEWADLWKYDPVTNMWTWVDGPGVQNTSPVYGTIGVPDSANNPGSISWGAQTWTDLNGDLWLFGSGTRLWRYNIATNAWSWFNSTSGLPVYGIQGVPSDSTTPGIYRDETSATWVDDTGNLWLFGGKRKNDLWKYNILNDQWTWMKGSNLSNQPDVYGIKGVEDSLNTPGARAAYSSWKDSNGNFWLFGGGKLNFPAIELYNDLWMYRPATNNWTWMGGSNMMNQGHVYGDPCLSSSIFIPAAREEGRSRWVDNNGNFWLLGGGYSNSSGYAQKYGDLWTFNPLTLQWAYVNGGLNINPSPVIGTVGIPSINNRPGGKFGAVGFTSLSGELYLFGGGFSSNDLWKYTIDTTCVGSSLSVLANFSTVDTQFCDSACIDFIDISTNSPTSWLWSFPGAVPDTSSMQNPTNICYSTAGVYTVSLIATNAVSSNYIRKTGHITITNCSPPEANFTTSQQTYCDSTCINFTDSSSNNATIWQWNFPGAVPDTSSLQNPSNICYTVPGVYSVELIVSNLYGTDTIVKNNFITTHISPIASVSFTDSIICMNDSITLSANTNTGVTFQWYHNSNTLSGANNNIYNASIAGKYYFLTTDSLGCQTYSDTVELFQDTLQINSILNIPFSNCISANLCAPFDSSYSYLWNTNEISPCINIDSSGTYLVTITNINGCESNADTIINFPTPSYYSMSYPLSCDSDQICGYPGYINYLWSTGDTTQCINVFATDSFTVTLTDSNYCTVIGTLNSNIITLSSSVIQSNDTLIALPFDSSYTYLWQYNNVASMMCDSIPYCVLTLNGNYQVIVSDTNGCIDTSAVFSVSNVGLNQNAIIPEFKIIPNPTTGQILLELVNTSNKEAIIQILSSLGQNLHTEIWNVNNNINRKYIDLSNFSGGYYHCIIIVDGMSINKTFEILHD